MRKNILNIFAITRLFFYICFFLIFILVPTTVFIENDVYGFDNNGRVFSPTTGVTRAFSSLMHGRIKDAFYFNPVFTLAIAPICLYIFFQDIYTIIKRLIFKESHYSIIESFFVGH